MANRVQFVIVAKNAFTGVAKKVVASTKSMRKQFKGLKFDMSGLKGQFTGLVAGVTLYAGALKFLKTGMNFEDSLADLSAITGAAGKDLEFLSGESMRLATVAKTSSVEVLNAFKLMASAKDELLDDPKALANVTEQVLLLANASGVDLAIATSVVAESLNQFGAGADQAARFVNVLAAGAKFGASEVADSGEAVVKSGVAAKLAKLSFEELNAALQVLAKGGIKGVIAGTQLKTSLIKLESQGIRKIKPSVVGFEKALENLSNMHLSTKRMSKLFGLEAINTGKILIENSKSVGEFTRKLTGTSTAAEQSKVRLATFSNRIKDIGTSIDNHIIKTFNRLEEEKVFTNLAKDFGMWVESFTPEDIKSMAEAFKIVASAVSLIGKAFGTVIKLIAQAGTSMGTFAAQVSLGEFGKAGETLLKKAILENSEIFGLTPPSGLPETSKAVTGKNEADINVNVNAPAGVVDSVKTKAKTPSMNIGVNMNTSLAG